MRKRTIAAIVCVAGIVGALAATAVAQSQRFPDVPLDHYAFEAVEWAAEVGVTTGYTDGTFKPERPLIKRHAVVFMERYYDEILQAEESADFTRGDMMVLLKAINDGTIRGTESDTAAESPSEQGASQRFPDVPLDHYAFEAVEWAAEVGVTTGYTDGTFKPERPLIKRHAVVFMERYYDEILQAEESADFTRGDMMVLLKAINDGTIGGTESGTADTSDGQSAEDTGYQDTGDATEEPSVAPTAFAAVSAGFFHSCGLRGAGTIVCWGDNSYFQRNVPDGTYTAVTAGIFHSCGLRTDGTVICWGSNEDGQADEPDGTFSAVSTGGYHSCGLRTDETVECWGSNTYRDSTQAGQTDAPAGTFSFIDAGAWYSCGPAP